MAIFGLNRQEIENNNNNAVANPYVPERDNLAGFFEGSLSAPITGIQQGFLEGAMLLSDEENERKFLEAKKALTPDPQVTGWLGNVLQGVSSIIPAAVSGTLAAGGNPVGGALAVGESKGYAAMKTLQLEGVDEKTAAIAGAIEGVAQGLGVIAPVSVGGKVATRIGTGAGINVGIGATQRGATGEVLEANGYKEMADQYRIVDGMAMMTDAIIGGVFGGLHLDGKKANPLPSEVDAALAANNIHNLEIDAAPGIPADISTRNAHVAAMDVATEQVLRGEPVTVSETLADTNFIQKPENVEITNSLRQTAKEIKAKPSKTLLQFIADRGGVRDTGGELTGMDAQLWHRDKPFQRKLLRSSEEVDNEFTPDAVARAAWEAGYFADFGENRPMPNDLFEAVRDELAGNKRLPYNESEIKSNEIDPGQVEHYYNSRAEELGLDTKSLDPDDIILAVHEREAIMGEANPDHIEAAIDHRLALSDIPFEDFNDTAKQQSKARATKETGAGQEPATGKIKDGSENEALARDSAEGSQKLVEEIIAEKPDLKITDESGNVMTVSEAMQKADDEIAQAEKDKSLFETAVNCFMRYGDA